MSEFESKELDKFKQDKKRLGTNLKIALSFFLGMAFMFFLFLITKQL
jgi:hypothetical protein